MKLRYPEYYEKFQCIAGKCEDTCCAGWEIDIDDDSYEYYMQVPGEIGERLRKQIKEYYLEDEDVYEKHGFVLREGGRCPFLNQDNLCELILELGEDSLCYVCTHTPRNYFEYDQTREISISPSCPEAGRWMLLQKTPVRFIEKETDESLFSEETEEERFLENVIREARDMAILLLQNREQRIGIRMCCFLLYSKKVQELLNKKKLEQIPEFVQKVREERTEMFEAELQRIRDLGEDLKDCYRSFCLRMKSFSELSSINTEWENKLERIWVLFIENSSCERYAESLEAFHTYMSEKDREHEVEQFVVYYADLMLKQAMDDENFWGKAQFVAVSFLMLQDMCMETFYRNMKEFSSEEYCENVRIYAKEIEHSQENLEFLEEELLFEENYRLENLLHNMYTDKSNRS